MSLFVSSFRGPVKPPVESRGVLRPCAGPGCSELVERGRCAKCQPRYDAQRDKTATRGYDADHKRLRVHCFERDGWRCVDCGWEPDIVRMARTAGVSQPPATLVLRELRERFAAGLTHLHADHQIPVDQAPHLRLDLDNLKTRCDRCHGQKTRAEHANQTA